MTNFKDQAAAIIESLESQSKQTPNFAQLELLILEATQKLGKIAAETLEPKVSEGISPLETRLQEMPAAHEQKRNSNSDPENTLG
jgi:hypothetical protein